MNLELIETVVDLIEMGAIHPRDIVKSFRSAIESTLRQQTPQRTETIQSLQCFHCQVTIETLNDKVMHLISQRTWVGLTDEDERGNR